MLPIVSPSVVTKQLAFNRVPQLFQAAYLLKSKASNAGTQNSHWATVLLPKRNWNDIERNHESN